MPTSPKFSRGVPALLVACLSSLAVVACNDASTPTSPTSLSPSVSANASVTDLGTLGGTGSGATGVNDHGIIVGVAVVPCTSCTPKTTPSHAFRWQSGTMTDIGTLGGRSSAANAINQNDWIVGWGHLPNLIAHAALWKPGQPAQDLGSLGSTSIAYGINNNGQVVGQTSVTGVQGVHAFLWSNGTMTDLGLLPGGDWSVAQSINDNGLIAGQASSSIGAIHAVIWRNGVIKDLGVLPGTGAQTRFSVANAVNNLGQVTGYSEVPGGAQHLFLWQAGKGMKDLGVPPGGSTAQGNGINNLGQIVGSFTPAGGLGHAFLWKSGVFTDLGTLPTGNVSVAYGINNAGLVAGNSNRQAPGHSYHITHAASWTTP